MDIRINNLNEFLNGRGLPVARVKELVFQSAEEAFAGGVIR